MPRRYFRPHPAPTGALAADFAGIREELGVSAAFPADVEEAARSAVSRGPAPAQRADLRGVEFFTVDPPGSRDLDQAMQLERDGDGFRVRYAIADVGAFVERGDAVEREAWQRGVTVYMPDERALLYPSELSQGAASLLPGEERPAIVFTIGVGGDGEDGPCGVEPATVVSRSKLTYADVEDGLLREIGELLAAAARRRGSVQVEAPAQLVLPDASPCGYRLAWERRLPSEDWNAQISLLAGRAAAALMVAAGVGLLRTQEPAAPTRVERLRRLAAALGVPWPAGVDYDDFVMSLDASKPRHAALLQEARGVMGHAAYAAFDGGPPPPPHGAIAARYAHTTAPLRRLADRYVLDLLVELAAGAAPDAGERATLAELPKAMEQGEQRAGQAERAAIDAVEARLLEHRVGETFEAVVLDEDKRGAHIQIADPPVQARLHGPGAAAPGGMLRVRLVRADPASRSLQFDAA